MEKLHSALNAARDFFNYEAVLSLLAGILVALLAYFVVSALIGGPRPAKAKSKGKSEAGRQFRNVFAIVDEGRRGSIIRYHMEKYECGREEAMRQAVEDRQRDANRWWRGTGNQEKHPGGTIISTAAISWSVSAWPFSQTHHKPNT